MRGSKRVYEIMVVIIRYVVVNLQYISHFIWLDRLFGLTCPLLYAIRTSYFEDNGYDFEDNKKRECLTLVYQNELGA
jgi:hypothetical protein